MGNNAAVIGGVNNVASGKYSIAMGFDAESKDSSSLVINLAAGGAQSSTDQQFLVNSELFTISIGDEEANISEDNIGLLCDELNTCGRRRLEGELGGDSTNKSDAGDGKMIRNLQKQIGKRNDVVE